MSDAWRATAFLSAYFFAFGVQLPYLPVWLGEARGLSGAMVALAVFGAALGRIAIGPILTAWAEARPWRVSAVALSLACAGGYAALLIVPHPVGVVLAAFATVSLVQCLMPLGEAALLQASGTGGLSFGLGRAIASTVFVAGVGVGGVFVDVFGQASIAPLLVGLCLVSAAVAGLAPRAPLGQSDGVGYWRRLKDGVAVFRSRKLALMLLAIAPIQAAHAFYYGFSARIWLDQGAQGGLTSLLWGVGVVTEILLLAFAARLPAWVSAERLILAGAIGGVVRWTAMGFQPDFGPAFVLQLLHGATFAATYLGAVRLIDQHAPAQLRAAAFAFQAAVATGAVTGLVGLASGVLFDTAGVKGYWAMALLCALAAAPAYLLTRSVRQKLPLQAR